MSSSDAAQPQTSSPSLQPASEQSKMEVFPLLGVYVVFAADVFYFCSEWLYTG